MRKLATALAVAIVCAVSATSYAAPSPSRGALALVGARSASVTIVLRSAPAVTDPFHLKADFKGSYAGYLLSDTHGRVLFGSISVHGLGMASGEGLPLAFSPTRLPAGRYVVTLLADGPAKVVVPLSSGSTIVARPVRPVRVFARVLQDDVVPATAAGSPLAYGATAVPAGHHLLASVTSFFTGTAAQAGEGDQCFTTAQLCQLGGDGGSFSYVSPGLGTSGGYTGMILSPADFGTGTRAVIDSADISVQAHHAGFVLVIE